MEFDNELELAAAYVPHLRYDKAEPFSLEGIGYTVYRETAKSPSCRRTIEVPKGGAAVEYAFYYDFDIQHLYDLEHSFVYLDGEGRVIGVESSFHGKFLNSMIEGVLEWEGSHPVLYVQPGKHAFLPAPDYFKLIIDRDTACNKNAGEACLRAGYLRMRRLTEKWKPISVKIIPSCQPGSLLRKVLTAGRRRRFLCLIGSLIRWWWSGSLGGLKR